MKKNEYDADLKNLICKIHEQEIAELPPREVLQGKYQLSDVFHQRMKRLSHKVDRKRQWHAAARYVVAAAAVVVLLFSIAHPQYLVEAKDKIMEWYSNHVEIQFKEDTGRLTIPKYEMEYVPEGYELVEDAYYEAGAGLVVYMNNDLPLYLDYELSDSGVSMNNEGVEFLTIEGNTGDTIYYFQAVEEGRNSTMTWLSEDGNISLTIMGVLNKEEMLKIQENVRCQ